ncbi:MAG: EAL domain-containing protein [Trueperaceae bacterium]|nr:EAL domain-containing protein [Trueperaceae bacterium]
MPGWLKRLSPLLLWGAYLVGYGEIVELAGSYAPLVALLPVAVSGWSWGPVGGLASGVLGYLAVQVRMDALGVATWNPLSLLQADQMFAFLACSGAGLVVGWMRRLEHNLHHERAARRKALVDPLTGTLVRQAFEERLRAELDAATATGSGLALLFVDLDRFKFVNDTYGHDLGDKLLREVGQILLSNVRDEDLVGRVGGDEFMVALVGVRDEQAAGQIARSLVRELSTPFTVDGRELQVSASIGVALYPRDGGEVEALLQSADAAMYQVKVAGKNAYNFSTVEVRTRLTRRLELERVLRRALAENEFKVVYQPQFRIVDGSLVGFEALLRWHSPDLGKVSPAEFIPVAEEAGMIAPIGHWMLRETAMQLRAWLRQGFVPVRVAVNVSTLQFHQSNFVDTVRGALDDSGIDPGLFELEVTESVLERDNDLAVRILRQLQRLGVRIALDDFGTGYSSLAYLQSLPIGTLKIDRSFVQRLAQGPLRGAPPAAEVDPAVRSALQRNVVRTSGGSEDAAPIVEAICAMAHKLNKEVVAEGVETAYQRDFLRRLGADTAQGYFYAKPMMPAQAEELLKRVTTVTAEAIAAARASAIRPPRTPSDARTIDPFGARVVPETTMEPIAPARHDIPLRELERASSFDELVIWK